MFLLKRRTKGETYLYFAQQIREGKTTKPQIMKSLGALSRLQQKDPDILVHLQEELDRINSGEDSKVVIELSSLRNRDSSSHPIGHFLINRVIDSLDLVSPIRKGLKGTRSEYDTATIARDLISERIINSRSKFASYHSISRNELRNCGYSIHDVYRALARIGTSLDDIVTEYAKLTRKSRDISVVNYDLTNFYFEIEEADKDGIRQYGISKEHRPNPIVQMGLFINQDGFPIALNVNPGNTGEQQTPIPTQRLMAKAGILSYVYCADSGINSAEIKAFNNIMGRRYVVAQSIKKMEKARQDWALSDDGWMDTKGNGNLTLKDCPDDGFLYKEDKFKLEYRKKGSKEKHEIAERTIIIYSRNSKLWQDSIMESQIERALKKIKDGLRANPNSPDRLVSIDRVTDDGEVAEKEIRKLDKEKIEDETRYHGFYAISSNILEDEMDALDVIAINSGRWRIESFFRTMKTTLDTRPIYLQNDESIKAHLLLCTLSVYVLTEIAAQLRKVKIQATPDEIQEALQGIYATDRVIGYELGHHQCDEKIDRIRKAMEQIYNLESLEKEVIRKNDLREIKKILG